ncbi:hypothetical protein AaE_008517 [Aphanomyces astaci]|uniref:SGNH hydrolase-type esterase domain-containing protein n=1 Tax=Aphanomyces astaci TaxID=112090 RepID=A0A6A5AAI2_APHAT|nr:hypothetical protein AaE_008517 [Aphanomyces astaci]
MGYKACVGAPLIITLGDSITQNGANPEILGYQVLLNNDYVRKADVVNRGLSGWTTRGWLPKVPLLLEEWRHKPPSLITIFLGANDAALIDSHDSQQHVPVDEYVANLTHMVLLIKTSFPQCEILFLTPPVVDDARWPSRANLETKKYAAACVNLAISLHLPVVDFWTSLQGRTDLLADGLHFNKAGNVVAHQMIVDAIATHLPHLTPGALPSEF